MEKELQRVYQSAYQEVEQLLSSISSILIGVNTEEKITRWNAVAAKTFDIRTEDIIGKPFIESKIQWNWDEVLGRIALCRDKDKPTRLDDIRFTRPDGKEGFLGITISPIVDENGIHKGYLLLGADITERRLLESQLSQAQKLESIGQLAAGIAHEINTPTQFVGDNISFLQESFKHMMTVLERYNGLLAHIKQNHISQELTTEVAEIEKLTQEAHLDYLISEIPESIKEALDGVARVAKIVKAMKQFSYIDNSAAEKTAMDINKALENTTLIARNEWKYVAEMDMDFDLELPLVSCLPSELNQVFLNIIINAAHAIEDARGKESSEMGRIRITTQAKADFVEIRISDTGKGIPKKIRSKIFDPFFTTKEVGKGTGQGLAISHNVIVDKHGGILTYETVEGKGTTFIIQLPLHDEKTLLERS